MQHLNTIGELRAEIAAALLKGRHVGLVPTMGYLHAGHLSLIKAIKQHCDFCVLSIFVNPLQFNNAEDLSKYPRDLEHDKQLLSELKPDVLFTPTEQEMYPGAQQTKISVCNLSQELEGKFRPGHFEGVATVVSMLFNIVDPHCAIFGEKDFQQLRIIEQMVSDLKYDISIIRAAIVREEDGLALSSRNIRLSPQGRKAALNLSQGLFEARQLFKSGVTDATQLKNALHAKLKNETLIETEYVAIVDDVNLKEQTMANNTSRILLAAWVDKVRLIDNISLS